MSDTAKSDPVNPPEAPVYPDPASGDPREEHLDRAHDIDPGAGRSDDPRVDGGDPRTHTAHTDDGAWQNEFTEETMPPPEAREDAAHDLELDPT